MDIIKSKEELMKEIDECLGIEPKTKFVEMKLEELKRYKKFIDNDKDTYMSFAYKAKTIVDMLKQYKNK